MGRRLAALACAGVLSLAGCTPGDEPRSQPAPRRSPGAEPRCEGLDRLVRRVRAGYVPGASPDLSLIPREPNYVGSAAAPVHSGPWDYLARVPLVAYGPGIVEPGNVGAPASMDQVAPTMGELAGFRDRGGKVLPQWDASGAPRLVVALVWDGGGHNVLEAHPDSHPFLDSLTGRARVYTRFEIGSSPSVTPPVHATLGTGRLPRVHGIPGLRTRTPEGEYLDPFVLLDPGRLRVPTLADRYGAATSGRAVTGMVASVNWHLGMIGHGSAYAPGNPDPVVLVRETGELFTNPDLYSLPVDADMDELARATRALDATDGEADGAWRGHPLDDPLVRYATPAHVSYVQSIVEATIEATGMGQDRTTDLLFINLKSLDDAGHRWGMTSPETGLTLRASDDALRRFVGFLDREVGRYVLFLTADHGQTPYPQESGAWPIGGAELARDVNARFDSDGDEVALADRVASPGIYVNRSELGDNGVTLADVGAWVSRYTVAENAKDGAGVPARFRGREGEALFDAVLAGRRLAGASCR